MIEFVVKQTMSLSDWEDHVMGSGAWSWDWWHSVESDSEGVDATWYSDVDNSLDTETAFLTWQEIADKCSELAREHPAVMEQLVNDDFDAVYMDCVLQYAFIGEIRYG